MFPIEARVAARASTKEAHTTKNGKCLTALFSICQLLAHIRNFHNNGTSWVNTRVKLHSQVHFGLCCITKQLGLISKNRIGCKKNWGPQIFLFPKKILGKIKFG